MKLTEIKSCADYNEYFFVIEGTGIETYLRLDHSGGYLDGTFKANTKGHISQLIALRVK